MGPLRVVNAVLASGRLYTGLDADQLHLSEANVKVFPREKLHPGFQFIAGVDCAVVYLDIQIGLSPNPPKEDVGSVS